jgi:hypothetical protein
MTCYCCGSPLARASDVPDVRWMRYGDRYCGQCEHVVSREQLVDGWPTERWRCLLHRDAPKGDA